MSDQNIISRSNLFLLLSFIILISPLSFQAQSGCTDVWACNYNPEASTLDDSCIYPACADENACNYFPEAICGNSTCHFETDVCTGFCASGSTGFGFTNLYESSGWIFNPDGGNGFYQLNASYLSIAGNNDETLTNETEMKIVVSKSGLLFFDWCYHTDGFVALDPAYVRINQQKFTLTSPEEGNSQIDVYSILVETGDTLVFGIENILPDDSRAVLTIANFQHPVKTCGCTDPYACNYNPDADLNDFSCNYSYGCQDPEACNYDPEAICEGDCFYSIDQCADVCINEEDSGVDFLHSFDSEYWTSDFGLGNGSIEHNIGSLVITGASNGFSDLTLQSIEIPESGYFLFCWNYFSQQAPYWNPSYFINDQPYSLIDPENPSILHGNAQFYAEEGDIIGFAVEGADPFFNPGILSITNFLYPISVCPCCLGDSDNNGVVNIIDLLTTSSNYSCNNCTTGDANCDGTVNVIDLLTISSFYGNICP